MTIQKFDTKNLWVALFLFVLCIALFAPTLDHPFMMDDKSQIVRNEFLFDAGFLQIDYFNSDSSKVGGKEYVVFRPLTQFLNALPAYFFGEDPFAYRVISLLLFYLACLSVYELLNLIFKNFHLSLLATVLFCIHPINGVLVNYITATGYSVLVLSINLALICFLWAQQTNKKRYFIASMALFVMALLCHETAIAFPLYLGAILFFVQRQNLKKVIIMCLPFLVILAQYLFFRQYYALYTVSLTERLEFIGITLTEFIASYFQCVLWYVKALLSLDGVVLMWASPVIKSNLILWNIVFLSIFVAGISLLLFRLRGEKAFGLSWLAIGLALVVPACLSRPSQGVIIEPHWLFFSSMGFCVLVAAVILKAYRQIHRIFGIFVGILLFFTYGLSTLSYNELWASEKKYCHYMLDLSPQMRLTTFWLANAYVKEGDLERAKHYYTKSIRGHKDDWEVYTNLGYIEDKLGNTEKAIRLYQKAIMLDSGAAQPRSNLSSIYIIEKKYDKAETLLHGTIRKNPYFIDAKKNLAVIYIKKGLKERAKQVIEQILEIKPQDKDALSLLQSLD